MHIRLLDDIYHMSIQDSHLFRLYIGDINSGAAVTVVRKILPFLQCEAAKK